jgi:hypothetical protein
LVRSGTGFGVHTSQNTYMRLLGFEAADAGLREADDTRAPSRTDDRAEQQTRQ